MKIEGVIIGFDEYMNIVLDESEEIQVKTSARRSVGVQGITRNKTEAEYKMCGNFGLLQLGASSILPVPDESQVEDAFKRSPKSPDNLDLSLNASMHEVSRLGGMRMVADEPKKQADMLPPLIVLQSQTACTEIRGGQAGGYSTLEYAASTGRDTQVHRSGALDNQEGTTSFPITSGPPPKNMRVRLVARKRHPLAADLAALYVNRGGHAPAAGATFTVIGHTRFATSSANVESELHPHEWVPFHDEFVWSFDAARGTFNRTKRRVGLHLSHNGDFDAMEAYSQTMVVEEVGLWLERIHHVPNNTRGDSPKVCGTMDLFRVQGRWAAAARLAWVRCILKASTDVSGGEQLSKTAPNTFPGAAFWDNWADFIEEVFARHINNVVKVLPPSQKDPKQLHRYYINPEGERQFVEGLEHALSSLPDNVVLSHLGVVGWSPRQIRAFFHYTVRGFFHSDLYTAMTEFLSRAEGSFGLQVHSTLEPGVVVIASKGQPMSVAFDPTRPLILFGSEAEAVAVPIDKAGKWLPERIDLDNHGEIMRLGEPRALLEGTFASAKLHHKPVAASTSASSLPTIAEGDDLRSPMHPGKSAAPGNDSPELSSHQQMAETLKLLKINSLRSSIVLSMPGSFHGASRHGPSSHGSIHGSIHGTRLSPASTAIAVYLSKANSNHRILLQSGIEIRSYSLTQRCESRTDDLLERCVSVVSAPVPYDPKVDLVAGDLKVVPAVLSAIDKAWAAPGSIESIAGQALAECLVECMLRRMEKNLDTTDLLIGGVEVSLWMAEQWAADLRAIFPQLNVVTVSANKLLGLGSDSASKVYFSGADDVLSRRIDSHTCALLISQSGQTFPTLHATRKVAKLVGNRLWLLTGCFNSKMEQAMVDSYKDTGRRYGRDRVFNNYSGNRPAEPSSVAVAATWHTLTRLMMHIIIVSRTKCPGGRLIHSWDYDENAEKLQRWARCALWRLRLKIHIDKKLGRDGKPKGADRHNKSLQLTVSRDHAHVSFPLRKKTEVCMLLSDGCIEDMVSMLSTTVVANLSVIVGHDDSGRPLVPKSTSTCSPLEILLGFVRKYIIMHVDTPDYKKYTPATGSVYLELVSRGRAWADHVNEYWRMLCFAGFYVIFSVGLGLPIFGLIADAIVAIIRAGGGDLGYGRIGFASRAPFGTFQHQGAGWWLVGLAIQFADALLYVFIIKIFSWTDRLLWGRPYWARFGKRTVVIVDTPCVHQLLEVYVSKLYSQSYSFMGVDVHGASGLDHFVHRFTHRVVRGLLLAVGRPDGRLCCLAKSEAAVFLAAKQAAFIRNPDYPGPSGGPEFVTIGHNPFQPNVGLAHHIVLRGGGPDTRSRRKFVDEYLYERLFMANKPFTRAILRALALSREHSRKLGLIGHSPPLLRIPDQGHVASQSPDRPASVSGSTSATAAAAAALVRKDTIPLPQPPPLSYPAIGANPMGTVALANRPMDIFSRDLSSHPLSLHGAGGSAASFTTSIHGCGSMHGYRHPRGRGRAITIYHDGEPLPYGTHNIDPSELAIHNLNQNQQPQISYGAADSGRGVESSTEKSMKGGRGDSMFAEFVMNSRSLLTAKHLSGEAIAKEVEKSNDPAVRLAFSSKLDSATRLIQDRQERVQHFYETRIASLERYIAFCVMFHAMAEASHAPWLQFPWDIARSQSNLRVATTAAPISAGGDGEHGAGGEGSPETKKCARMLAAHLRGFDVNF